MCLWLQLDLSYNQLCGVYYEYGELRGTYTAEGVLAIANALKVTASLTSINLAGNCLCGIWEEYESGKGMVQKGTYSAQGITAIAEALKVTASLTRLDVKYDALGEEGEAALRKTIESRSGFELLL